MRNMRVFFPNKPMNLHAAAKNVIKSDSSFNKVLMKNLLAKLYKLNVGNLNVSNEYKKYTKKAKGPLVKSPHVKKFFVRF